MIYTILYQNLNWILHDIKEKMESTYPRGLLGSIDCDLISFNKTQMSGLNLLNEKIMFVHVDDLDRLRGLELKGFIFHDSVDTEKIDEILEFCLTRMR